MLAALFACVATVCASMFNSVVILPSCVCLTYNTIIASL
jgi:hypothetical protein